MDKVSRFLIAWGLIASQPLLLAADIHLAEPNLSTAKPRDLWATQYYAQRAVPVADGIPLLDRKGDALTKPISKLDWCLGAIEGTFAITEAGTTKVFTYAGTKGSPQVDCLKVLKNKPIAKDVRRGMRGTERSRFKIPVGPVGDGSDGFILVPYRTIAVDSSEIPPGSVVYIPEARGMTLHLADGTIVYHDGFFFAGDHGGAVHGRHIDVFCGLQTRNCLPSIITGSDKDHVAAYVVEDEQARELLIEAHTPKH